MWTLIASIGGFLPGVFGKQLSFKAAKYVGVFVLIVLAVLLFFGARAAYNSSVISRYKAEVEGETYKAAREADHKADAEEQKRMENLAAENDRLESEAAKAAQRDPVSAGKTVGPVTSSYYDNLPEKKR